MVFIIAEAGINHIGDLPRALAMVDAAADAGADAVKFQSFTAEALEYEEGLTTFLQKCQLSEDDHYLLKNRADVRGIEFMSTPFDLDAVDLLMRVGVKRFKVSSGKVGDLSLIKYISDQGLPMILSAGMATQEELRRAWVKTTENSAILYCVSKYPTPLHEIDFRNMATLRQNYGSASVGFSDHTCGIEASIIAAASGAEIIEKHFTLDRSLPGPDQCCSLVPNELWSMIQQIRKVGA